MCIIIKDFQVQLNQQTSTAAFCQTSLGGKSQLSTIQLPIPEDGIFECLWQEEIWIFFYLLHHRGGWGGDGGALLIPQIWFLHCSYSSTSRFSVYAVSGGDVHLP